jgi:predicted enzyme related to lactoylglutathione lyase
MTSRIASVTFDCEDASSLADFWAQVVGRAVSSGPPEPSEFFASIEPGDDGSPMMMFLKVPEPKTAKNRAHIDLATDDRAAEVARLVELGATHLYDKDEWGISWATLTDPEGNEFCVSEHLS